MGRKIKGKSRKTNKRKPCEGALTADQCAQQFLRTLQPSDPKSSDPDAFDFEDDDVLEQAAEEVVVNGDGDDVCMDDDSDDGDGGEKVPTQRVWDPRLHPLEEGEELQVDSTAYTVYHSLRVEWPCLTFDVIRDQLGAVRPKPPYQLTVAAGTQAERHDQNKICIWRVSNLRATRHDDDSSSEDEGDDEDEEMVGDHAVIVDREFEHPGGVNRLRCCPQRSSLLGTWSENGTAYVWDATDYVDALDSPPNQLLPSKLAPVFQFSGHQDQGYALDWSPVAPGRLLTGDCKKFIHVWNPRESTWDVSPAFKGHTASVEDVQWSPNEQGVFISCSIDQSIRVWDTRSSGKAMLVAENAHDMDINVMSWNQSVAHLLASGCDDGSFKIWDLRQFRSGRASGFFRWHEKPVTAIQWHPSQDSVLAVTSEDDSCTIWDMSVELDREELQQGHSASGAELGALDIPPQLVFVHRGQTQIKDVRFHPQIPSLLTTTALDGFNFFKPDNVEALAIELMALQLKICVAGPSKTGKSLITNLVTDHAGDHPAPYEETIGCRILECELNVDGRSVDNRKVERNVRVGVELWDLGDNRFEKCFLAAAKSTHGLVIVYDPNKDQEANVHSWYRWGQQSAKLDNRQILLVANPGADPKGTGHARLPPPMDKLSLFNFVLGDVADLKHAICEFAGLLFGFHPDAEFLDD